MRTARSLFAVLLLVAAVTACSLKKADSGDCVADPSGAGGGTQICTKPPPTPFDQLGQ